MTLEEYAQAKEAIINKMIADLLWIFRSMLVPGITPLQWARFIQLIYPRVKQARDEATHLAREFYDSYREKQLQSAERVDFYREAHYPQEWLSKTLEPIYNSLREDAEDGAEVVDTEDVVSDQDVEDLTDVRNRVAKVVEDGARRTLLNGVQNDPHDIVGWARYDPRPPTCAFCTVLISRGPVYRQNTGGSREQKSKLLQLYQANDLSAINRSMKKWHPGCTCIVVPVFKFNKYPSEKQELAALELYQAGRERANSGNFKAILKAMRENAKEEDSTREEKLPKAA